MIKRLFALLAALLLPVTALAETLPFYDYAFSGEVVAAYESPTLRYSVERLTYEKAACYVTKIWMADPGRQIRKGTAAWREGLALPSDMAERVPGAVLAVNGSGYVSPQFPEIPDNYPGESADYYYTPLGSLTVTDGEIFRSLQGVPYYGLTLQADGLHLHVGEDIEEILPSQPTQTWSFYVECPIIRDHQSILDPDWTFTNRPAMRTIMAKMDQNNYLLLTVTGKTYSGLTMAQCVTLLQTYFDPEWAYNLDGGPSSALLVRGGGKETFDVIHGNNVKDADIMAFVE